MNIILEIIKAIIYGIIQGITEWLPISSTGHLILAESFIPLAESEEFFKMFLVVIQFGSILAVIVLYFKELFPFGFNKNKKETASTFRLWILIIIATIPAAIVGLLFDDIIDAYLHTPLVIAITLIIYGIIFIIVEKANIKAKVKTIDQLSWIDALKIGCFQTLALIPGTSRSGATIIGSRIIGVNRQTAAKFSFFLAIPVMFGASLLKIIKMDAAFTINNIIILAIGVIVSFVVSLIVIKSLINFIKKHTFIPFGYYRIILGLVLIIYTIATKVF